MALSTQTSLSVVSIVSNASVCLVSFISLCFLLHPTLPNDLLVPKSLSLSLFLGAACEEIQNESKLKQIKKYNFYTDNERFPNFL